jgi:ATP-independent RNA helicase DbpA
MTPTPSQPVVEPAGFGALALSPAMQANLVQLGYTEMTPIQAAALPPALLGKDLIAQAKTGSGKTAAFALALLANLNPRRFAVQALVLCPTRELADQVTTEIRRLARAEENIKVVTLCGGVPLRNQMASLENGAHIAVGTPGRIMDHLERGTLDIEALNTLVLDEADRMLDMGFFDDIATVARQCPKQRQTLLFSATYPEGIAKLSAQFMREPITITVEAQHGSAQDPAALVRGEEQRAPARGVLLLNHFRPASTLAFCNTKAAVPRPGGRAAGPGLQRAGAVWRAGAARARPGAGAVCQPQLLGAGGHRCGRARAGHCQLAAVINVDVTPDPEVHIHRIGRTGRAARKGLALNLASLDEMGSVGKIELLQGRESQWHPLAELTPTGSGPLRRPWPRCRSWAGARKKSAPVTCWAR